MAARGRSKSEKHLGVVMEALMCKSYGCTPSQLAEEDAQTVFMHAYVFAEIMKKNPFL